MIPLTLRITNFRSVKGTLVFSFPQEPGLYFMQGDNQVERRLEANGAGKSTIWDALTWVSFEKTPSGLKAGDVCNWDAEKGTVVEFDYYLEPVPDCIWTVRRTWKPNTWTLSHIAEFVTDEEVIDLTKAESNAYLSDLRLNFTSFLHSILTAQRKPMFLDLEHNTQAALFSEVLGLDRWLDYSAIASKKASGQDLISRGLERELASLRGQLESLGSSDIGESLDAWERTRDDKLARLDKEHADLLDKSSEYRATLTRAQEDETNARAWVAKAQPDAGVVKDHNRARAEISDYRVLLAQERVRYQAVHQHLEHLEANAECPTCNQTLSKDARFAELRKAEKALAAINALIAKYEKELKCTENWEKVKGEELAEQERELVDALGTLDEAQRAVSDNRRTLDLNERELDRIEEQAERLTAEANPYAAMEEKARRDGARLRDDVESAQRKLDASNERHSLLSFWVRGFKELRLTQIAEALTELEIEVNSCVTALGLVDWELNFQVDRETKSGNIQRGFNTFVKSPHNDRAVPWEAWSGGEAQRLRMAATMGLANLIRSRTGAKLNLEVWDEPTMGLSPQGKRDLLEALASRAQAERRQIWLIDHESHDFGGFAGGALITKTLDGSSITQY